MKPINLVMFDYDGVIVDSLKVFCQSYIGACWENGLMDIQTQQDVLALFEHNVYASLVQRGVTPSTVDKILAAYERRQKEHLGTLELFAGMTDALEKIASASKVYIITSNLSQATESVMERYGVTCYEEVIGAEKEKSKINKIKKVMKRHEGCPAFYVGDTKGDMLEGREAGTTTIGVSWGWHSVEKLREGRPDYIVQSPQELVEVILQLDLKVLE